LVDLITLLEDIAAHIRACPEVVGELAGDGASVAVYADITGTANNSLTQAVYTQPNGTVLVAWGGTSINSVQNEVQQWEHSVELYLRAVKGSSPLRLLCAVMDGTPAGSSIRWRYMCVNDDVLPMVVNEVLRGTDEEGLDYILIRSSFREKGDEVYEYGMSSKFERDENWSGVR
jgi:hypothetical protein